MSEYPPFLSFSWKKLGPISILIIYILIVIFLFILMIGLAFAELPTEQKAQLCNVVNFSFGQCLEFWEDFYKFEVNQTIILQNQTFIYNFTVINQTYINQTLNSTIIYNNTYEIINNSGLDLDKQAERDFELEKLRINKGIVPNSTPPISKDDVDAKISLAISQAISNLNPPNQQVSSGFNQYAPTSMKDYMLYGGIAVVLLIIAYFKFFKKLKSSSNEYYPPLKRGEQVAEQEPPTNF